MTHCESAARKLLYRLGANMKYRGFGYTVWCVEEMLLNREARECIKIAYMHAKEQGNAEDSNIERDINTMIRAIWAGGNRRLLDEIADQSLTEPPKAKEFLQMLTDYILKE